MNKFILVFLIVLLFPSCGTDAFASERAPQKKSIVQRVQANEKLLESNSVLLKRIIDNLDSIHEDLREHIGEE